MKTLFENTEEIVGNENANIAKDNLNVSNNVSNIEYFEKTDGIDNKAKKNSPEANNNFKQIISELELPYLRILNKLPEKLIDVCSHLDSKYINSEKQ